MQMKRRDKALCALAALCVPVGVFLRAIPGLTFSGTLFFCAAAFFAVLTAADALAGRYRAARVARSALIVFLCAGFALFLALEVPIVRGAHPDEDAPVDAIVILGAGVNGTEPSRILWARLTAARAYAEKHPGVPIVCSGGQGPGEEISEAACMAQWLTAHGVAPERLRQEARSTSTAENFAFSEALLRAEGIGTQGTVAVVTSEFHLYRARRLAGEQRCIGVAAPLPDTAFDAAITVNYYIREAFGLAKLLIQGG